jgi:cathepsin L
MEEKFRMKIFMENKAKIARHNQKAHKGEKSYFLKMNHFGDQVPTSFFLILLLLFKNFRIQSAAST